MLKCHLSESSLDVSGVPYHANCTRPIPSQRLHQIEQSPVDKQGLQINDVVSILVHVHPSDTIGNETRQTSSLPSILFVVCMNVLLSNSSDLNQIRSMRSLAFITSNTKSGRLSRSSYTKETQ
ncbi:hypothetical protein AVEN_119005-1 [Araneus ventricosus]|uniref:Uncharacterized protein n=1 Tax=Araneus ventricosus TaxID=182803 RepID=A0A4Y2KPQ7_ARAVE|nr:hypothetical protein AVEN_119005-1 [Araneus ventricosus]